MPEVTSTGGAGGEEEGPCAQEDPACTMVDSDCVALVDNRDEEVFALRMVQTIVARPNAFKSDTTEGKLVNDAFGFNLPECRLNNGGTINLIVEIDTANGQGRAGVAKPVDDPRDGYSFVDEVVDAGGADFQVSPVLFQGSLNDEGILEEAQLNSITLPLYLNQSATDFILVPLRAGRLYDVQLSTDQNCIGAYNAFGLDPNNLCLPDEENGVYEFLSGGKAEGYVLLEEAEQVVINAFGGFVNETLCARFANDAGNFLTGSDPKRCRRNQDGEILYPGDWCAATNSPATPECNDAVSFSFLFAAAAVKLND